MEQFDSNLSSVIDSTLGLRCKQYGYQYSEIIRSLMSIYFCGGSFFFQFYIIFEGGCGFEVLYYSFFTMLIHSSNENAPSTFLFSKTMK